MKIVFFNFDLLREKNKRVDWAKAIRELTDMLGQGKTCRG